MTCGKQHPSCGRKVPLYFPSSDLPALPQLSGGNFFGDQGNLNHCPLLLCSSLRPLWLCRQSCWLIDSPAMSIHISKFASFILHNQLSVRESSRFKKREPTSSNAWSTGASAGQSLLTLLHSQALLRTGLRVCQPSQLWNLGRWCQLAPLQVDLYIFRGVDEPWRTI